MIKVIQERQAKPGKESALENLLIELRTKAMRQSGYISGETLVRVDDHLFYLAIGTWTRLEAWKAWENSQERLEIVQLLTTLLTEEPRISIYGPPLEDDLNI